MSKQHFPCAVVLISILLFTNAVNVHGAIDFWVINHSGFVFHMNTFSNNRINYWPIRNDARSSCAEFVRDQYRLLPCDGCWGSGAEFRSYLWQTEDSGFLADAEFLTGADNPVVKFRFNGQDHNEWVQVNGQQFTLGNSGVYRISGFPAQSFTSSDVIMQYQRSDSGISVTFTRDVMLSVPPIAMGCYTDNNGGNRDLPNKLMGPGTTQPVGATIESCGAHATTAGYVYFGLQNGNECWAGNTYGSQGAATNCNKNCASPKDWQICGGSGANSVYMIPLYMGCYPDNCSGGSRALPNLLVNGGANIQSCAVMAKAQGYAYFGLQNGGQCYGGNQLTGTPNASCDQRCSATPSQICGGTCSNSFFKIG